MSAARIDQLKSLLARVQERRAAPRVRSLAPVVPVAVPVVRARESNPSLAPAAQPSVPAVPVTHKPPVTDASLGVAKTIQDLRQVSVSPPEPATPPVLDLALGDMFAAEARAPSQEASEAKHAPASEPAARSPLTRAAPTVNDLEALTASEPPSAVTRGSEGALKPVPPFDPVFDSEPPTSATLVSAPELEAEPILLTAPSARVEAPVLARSEPVVRMVSAPKVEAPKSFGDLLELSLSLRTH
jgi:hypothetical protein